MNTNLVLEYFDQAAEAPDAVPRLRQLILDLAVRGRLVPQRAEDPPAELLLKHVDSRASGLVESGQIRPQSSTLPVGAEERPFLLPGGWMWTRLGRVADFSAGKTPSRKEPSFWNTGDFPWASIADIVDGREVLRTKETISSKAQTEVFKCSPSPAGTMIMSFKLSIGKIARLGIPAFHNEAIVSIRPHVDELSPFLFMALPQFARGGDTRGAIMGDTLNRTSLTNLLLPLPPLAEQSRIVAKVDELMALCDQLVAARATRETSRALLVASGLYHLAPAADDQDSNSPESLVRNAALALKELPRLTASAAHLDLLRDCLVRLAVRGHLVERASEWQPTTLGKLGTWGSGGTPKKGHPGYYGGDIPWLVIGDLNGGVVTQTQTRITEAGLRDSSAKMIEPGTVLIAMYGSIGKLGIAGVRCATNQAIAFCVPDLEQVRRDYLLILLRSLKADLIGKGHGAAQQNISQTILKAYPVSLPSLEEQDLIVERASALLSLCDDLETSLTARSSNRSRLLGSLAEGLLE